MTRLQYFPMDRGPCPDGVGYQGGWQITSYFGGRIDPITGGSGNHGGQDLAYAGCGGANLYAPADGTLAQSWDPSGGGNWSGITLDDGSYVGIGHAQAFAPGNPYRRVRAGDLIGWCDSTGGSTGDHVHFCYRPPGSGRYADPYDLLAECSHRYVGGGGAPIPEPEPEPPQPDPEDDDVNERPAYTNPLGEVWWCAPDGELRYIFGPGAWEVLQNQQLIQDPPTALDEGTFKEMLRAYNGNDAVDQWEDQHR